MMITRRILVLILVVLSLSAFSHSVIAEDKFAIAADGPQPMALIVKLAGVAPYFHIYDIDGNQLEVLENPHLDMAFGTGPAAATTLADMGVTVLVARRVPGPKMHDVMKERNIRLVRRNGTVQDVVDELRE
ncbi:MAG: NifB/NifX family molybdenum-iron cluster-binding protein [Gammaproteobacteria bacterium]|jgi:predicted Fe-Mo cluster-binding NifX family protein